jgi:hypothetical protein
MYPKHEEDLYAWAMGNAHLLKEKKFIEADMANIVEELETLGRSTRRELSNRLSILIAHLLKWQYQTNLRCSSWEITIINQRLDIKDVLKESPSLKPQIKGITPTAYTKALAIVRRESPLDLKSLPAKCPYTLKQCLDDDFYPE